ncbi:MAG: lecithin retinol acyltransferase family protein [Pseudomonadota bacterium]
MARGDHIKVSRLGYTHHGIDCGDGTVIHYSGEVGRKRNACVRRDSLDTFLDGSDSFVVVHHVDTDPPDTVLRRARSRLGERDYSLVFHNCEHFATWCKTGRARSRQVEKAVRVATGLGHVVIREVQQGRARDPLSVATAVALAILAGSR